MNDPERQLNMKIIKRILAVAVSAGSSRLADGRRTAGAGSAKSSPASTASR
jgi:hypothetical protein